MTTPKRRRNGRRSTSRCSATAPSTTTAGSPPPRRPRRRGHRSGGDVRRARLPVGTLPRDRGLQPGQQSRCARNRPSSGNCRICSGWRRPSTTCCRSTTAKVERLDIANRPSLTRGRSVFTYYPGQVRIPEGAAPDTKNKSFKIAASGGDSRRRRRGHADHPRRALRRLGLLPARRQTRLLLQPRRRRPLLCHRQGEARARQTHRRLDFKYDGGGLGKGGTATLLVDGKPAGEGKIERTLPFRMSLDETLDAARTPARPSARTTTCPSSSPARSTS